MRPRQRGWGQDLSPPGRVRAPGTADGPRGAKAPVAPARLAPSPGRRPPSLPATHPQPHCQPSFQASSWTQECSQIPWLNPCAAAAAWKTPQPQSPLPLPHRPLPRALCGRRWCPLPPSSSRPQLFLPLALFCSHPRSRHGGASLPAPTRAGCPLVPGSWVPSLCSWSRQRAHGG